VVGGWRLVVGGWGAGGWWWWWVGGWVGGWVVVVVVGWVSGEGVNRAQHAVGLQAPSHALGP